MGQRRQLLSIGFLCLAALVPPGILAQPSAPPATGSATQEFVETDLGPVEGIMFLTYSALGVMPEAATLVTLVYRGLSFWLPFVTGFAALRRLG